MNPKNKLIQQLKEANQRLKSVRRTWFLWIWFGYSGLIFSLFFTFIDTNKSDWLSLVAFCAGFGLVSLVLGLFFYGINAFVWSNCSRDINSSLSYVEHLEKQINRLGTKQEPTAEKVDYDLPKKYLNRGYNEFQVEYIKEAFYVNGLKEEDIDYLLSIKNDPHLLIPFSCHLKMEVEDYIRKIAREKAAKEVLDIFCKDKQ